MPKRRHSGYALFVKHIYGQRLQSGIDCSLVPMYMELDEAWRILTESEKAIWKDQAKELNLQEKSQRPTQLQSPPSIVPRNIRVPSAYAIFISDVHRQLIGAGLWHVKRTSLYQDYQWLWDSLSEEQVESYRAKARQFRESINKV